MKLLGTQPAHWDAESFEYELRFDAAPDDAQVEALAHAWSEHVEKGPTIGAGWRFAGPFAYFDVRPRKDPRPMFTHVEAFVRRANEIAPIVEVVNLMAAEDFPGLDPGPDLPHSQRPAGAFPPPAPHPAFEAVRRAIRMAKLEAQYGKWVVEVPAGKLGLAFTDPVPSLVEADVPEHLRARFPDGDGMRFQGTRERPRRIPVGDARIFGSLYLRVGGQPRELALPEGTTTRRLAVPHPDAAEPLVAVPAIEGRTHVVVTASCLDGSVKTVWTADPGEEVRALAWLTGRVLAVQTSVRALAVDVDSQKIFAGPKGGGYVLHALQGGRLLFGDKPQILAWNGKKLTGVSAFKPKSLFVEADGPEGIVVRAGAFAAQPTDPWLTVTGLADVLAKKCVPLPG